MKNKRKYLSVIILIAIGFSLIYSLLMHYSYDYVLTINFYVGVICWLVAIVLELLNHRSAKFCVILLLTLSAFNIISFSFINIAIGSGNKYDFDGFSYNLPSINPLFLMALVIYALIEKVNSTIFYDRVFHGSNSEIREVYQKEAKFYYEKFKRCSDEEFAYAVKNIKDYPKPAQDAINIIISPKDDIK